MAKIDFSQIAMPNTRLSGIETILETPVERDALFSFREYLSTRRSQEPSDLLSSAISIERSSFLPLCRLSILLNAFNAPWPIFQLLRCYSDAWKSLPEDAKHPEGDRWHFIQRVEEQVKALTGNHLSLLQAKSTSPAIHDPANHQIIDHRTVHTIIRNFSLPGSTAGDSKPVVAIALPNGPLLAVTVLATSAYYTAVPLISSGGQDFRKDLLRCGADTLLVSEADTDRLGLRDQWIVDARIRIFTVDLDLTRSNLSLTSLEGYQDDARTNPKPNTGDDNAILLFTSGTSGNKKLVPLTHFCLVAGASFVIESWNLTSSDICLNMMPVC